MSPRHAVLIGELQQLLGDLQQVVDRNQQLLQKYQATQDEDYIGSLALNLHGFYTGVERCFEEIARQIDQMVPSGTDWHRRLIRQMAAEVPSFRPPVIQSATRQSIDEYRAFRHVVRHVYAFNLEPNRVIALSEKLTPSFEALQQDIAAFYEFLIAASAD